MSNSESSSVLDARLESVETRLLRIERRLHLDAVAIDLGALPKSPPPSPLFTEPSSSTPQPPARLPEAQVSVPEAPVSVTEPQVRVPTAPSAMISDKSGDALLDWEQLIGGKWALWAGLLSIFGAIASFLAYTWRFLPPPPPEAKVAMGFFAGVAFLVAGEWTRKRAQRWFSEGLSGAGLAICFLSLWAGGVYFSVFGFGLTFGGMAIVSALGVWLAVRYDALGLNILSIIGAFATPVLLRGGGDAGGDTAFLLLSYIAVLNAGVVGVALFKRWRISTWLSLGATVSLLLFWTLDADLDAIRWQVWTFFSLYFLLYVGAACFATLARREETAPEEIGLILVATTLYAPFAHDLLRPLSGNFPGAFMFGFALLWAALCLLITRLAPANRALRDATGALGLLAFTVAIPIQIAQPFLGIALMGEAAVLAWLARRSESLLLRRAGQIVWGVALLPIVLGLQSAVQISAGLHAGSWPLLFGLAVTAWSAHRDADNSDELGEIYAASAVAGGAWLVAREASAWGAATDWVIAALGAYALIIFALGLKTRFPIVRDCAAVLAVCVALTVALLSVSATSIALPTVATIGALYAFVWLARRGETELLRRAGQIVWLAASAPLFAAMMAPAGALQWGLHAGSWPWILGLANAAALAWSAHNRAEEADELTEVYALSAVAGGAWLVAREVGAWGGAIQIVLVALSIYAVAVFAIGAIKSFATVRIGASILAMGVAASALWLSWSSPTPGLLPFANARFAALSVPIAALAAIYQLARAIDFPLHSAEKEAARAFPMGLSSFSLAALSTELYFGFAHLAMPDWANRAYFALAILWLVGALAALLVGLQSRAIAWRIWAYFVGGAALVSLPVNALSGATLGTPFANLRFAAFALAVAVCGIGAWKLRRAKSEGALAESENDVVVAATSFALGLALFSLTRETWEVGRYLAPGGGDWERGAQMAISLVWSLFGALLLTGGVQFRVQALRLSALALLALTVCKVFLFDLSFLDGAGRALSLGGLGVALVFISWLYGRFGRAEAEAEAT